LKYNSTFTENLLSFNPQTATLENSHDIYRLLKYLKVKGKVFPLQAQLWPRNWVEV